MEWPMNKAFTTPLILELEVFRTQLFQTRGGRLGLDAFPQAKYLYFGTAFNSQNLSKTGSVRDSGTAKSSQSFLT